ncbi:MAG TPA: UvrD-helicase domain-containing protein, partial [Planctomycetota bacterium]
MPRHLEGLNPAQREAVTTLDGPLLVLAGAGTGKTRVITHRIAQLLHKGASPRQVLAMTFTNKAATEMRERVAGLLGAKKAAELTVGTFHSFCVRLLRVHAERIGLPAGFGICDGSDQLGAMKRVLRELGADEGPGAPAAVLGQVSLLKNRLADRSALAAGADEDAARLAVAWERYQASLRRSKLLDFDDLLLETLRLLTEDAELRGELQDRFRWLLVDEFQDTNAPQYEIVRLLVGARHNLCSVGDDDQSIYGWRGADVSKILGFENDFPGATIIRLETNYRSTQQVLEAANTLIAHNSGRHEKVLHSDFGDGSPLDRIEALDAEDEADCVTDEINRLVRDNRARLSDFAILFRTAVQPRAF